MKALYTILKPIVTEKAIKASEKMSYTFFVHPKSTKIDVKIAIRELYGVEVQTVRMVASPAKTRGGRRSIITKRPRRKKAVITLKGRKKLDVTKIAKEKKK